MSFGVDGGDYRIDFLPGHKTENTLWRLLFRDGEDPLGDSDKIDSPVFTNHEANKRADGCESQVACSWGVPARRFQVFEEGQDCCRVDRLKRQLVNGATVTVRKKGKE